MKHDYAVRAQAGNYDRKSGIGLCEITVHATPNRSRSIANRVAKNVSSRGM
jgi:hypothetical protein